jgi:hypothetical protein
MVGEYIPSAVLAPAHLSIREGRREQQEGGWVLEVRALGGKLWGVRVSGGEE